MSPLRDHIFYMTFLREWKTTDIRQLFSICGIMIGIYDLLVANVGYKSLNLLNLLICPTLPYLVLFHYLLLLIGRVGGYVLLKCASLLCYLLID